MMVSTSMPRTAAAPEDLCVFRVLLHAEPEQQQQQLGLFEMRTDINSYTFFLRLRERFQQASTARFVSSSGPDQRTIELDTDPFGWDEELVKHKLKLGQGWHIVIME